MLVLPGLSWSLTVASLSEQLYPSHHRSPAAMGLSKLVAPCQEQMEDRALGNTVAHSATSKCSLFYSQTLHKTKGWCSQL